MTRKTYVLDTCVLLADPQSLLQFDEHDVVLPLVVVEELDRQKTRPDEVGGNARRAIRALEKLGASDPGGLESPRQLESGGTMRIELNGTHSDRLPKVLEPSTADHRILATCLNLVDSGHQTVLVTKDASLRIKGAQLGVEVEDYRADTVPVDESYSGVTEVEVDPATIDLLYSEGKAKLEQTDLLINQYVICSRESPALPTRHESCHHRGPGARVAPGVWHRVEERQAGVRSRLADGPRCHCGQSHGAGRYRQDLPCIGGSTRADHRSRPLPAHLGLPPTGCCGTTRGRFPPWRPRREAGPVDGGGSRQPVRLVQR